MNLSKAPHGRLGVVASLLMAPSLGVAQAHFLPANDALLRADLMLLVDEGVIRLPTSAWPIPAGDVAGQLERVDVNVIASPALRTALARVERKVMPRRAEEWRLREIRISSGEAGVLRSYDTLARDALEVQLTGGAATDRFNVTVSGTGVASADDGKSFRLDGTDVSVRWGNWQFSANQIDRWWGPGWDGSLILSTNARPMPALSLDRVRSEPFDFPVLKWFGPWRFTAFVGRAESHRPDVDASLFMGMRVTFKPLQIAEFGLSRTAQFCGRDRPCDFRTVKNVLFGDDNVGIRVSPEEEPGNQMAGADFRITSPFSAVPVAIYGQLIGEDNSSTGIPERYLGLLGAETWIQLDSGGRVRVHLEYADSACKWDRSGGQRDCAYRQAIFFAGYRYRGRALGHTTDADSESFSARASFVTPEGSEWKISARRARLDRLGDPDEFNTVTQGLGRLRAVEIGWLGGFQGFSVGAQLGYEDYEPGLRPPARQVYGFLQLKKAL